MSQGDDILPDVSTGGLAELASALRRLRRRHARLRGDTELTYRELAVKSGYAHGVINDYFTGKVLPPTDRLDVLIGLLGATGQEKKAFATARDQVEERRRQLAAGSSTEVKQSGSATAMRSLPRDVVSFVGRDAALRQIEHAAASGGGTGIMLIGGMAGVGKTAFAVHAAHRLAARFPDGQVFLPLYGHTPGRRPADPAEALASLLLMAGVSAPNIPPGLEPRGAMWRTYLAGRRLLLVLDDASGHEQVRPLLPGTPGCLVLVTSRKHLTAVDDARSLSLDTLSPDEACGLLVGLTGRPGLGPDDPAVVEIVRQCGYLPLAIGILARQLHHHPAWAARDLSVDLAAGRDHRLDLMYAENVSVAAAFDLSYQNLSSDHQQLFRRLGQHPGSDIDAYAAAALAGSGLPAARRGLESLYDSYLLTEPVRGRYRFHDLIREHARTLTAADPPVETDAATDRMLNYYLHTASAACRHVARRQPDVRVDPPLTAPDLADRKAAVAWLDSERHNLQAVADQAGERDRPGFVIAISGVMHGYLTSSGHWDQALTLHGAALEAVRRTDDRAGEPRALTGLGIVQRLTGDAPSALVNFARAVDACRELGDRAGEGAALNELGVTQQALGDPAAVTSMSMAVDIFRGLGDLSGEAAALNDLAVLQLDTGDFPGAATGLGRALELHRALGDRLWEANALNNIGVIQRHAGDYAAARDSHEQALRLFPGLGSLGHANALHNIGIVQLLTGDLTAAENTQAQALGLYRELGNQAGEARVLNSLGEIKQAAMDSAGAEALHTQALAIAVTVRSLLEEARAREGIGLSLVHTGRRDDGAQHLVQAFTLYQGVSSPSAARVKTVLVDHGLWPGG